MSVQTTVDESLEKRDQLFASATDVPSDRDWAVYRYVKVERWSTRQTAKHFKISQTRVCQIVLRVGKHLVKHAPVLSKEELARRMEASRQLAAEKLDYLYGQAMDCFYRAKTGPRDTASTARYASLVSRLILASAKLPPPQMKEYEIAEDSEEAAVEVLAEDEYDDEYLDEEVDEDEDADEESSPEEDCSAASLQQHAPVAEPPPPSSPTVAAMLSCVEQSRPATPAATDEARPVQPPLPANKAARRKAFFQT